jgi:hypothetical protein
MSPLHLTRFRLTDRDLAIVRWIGRLRFAEARHVAARFRMDERNAYRRLRGLVEAELLQHRRVFHGEPGAYSATKVGLGAAGVQLPPPRIDIRTYSHDRHTAELAIELEREFGERSIVTERELRSVDCGNPDRPQYAVRRGAERTRRGLHFPDLIVDRASDRPLAVEVELTGKGSARLASIVRAYVAARHLAGVRYYATRQAIRGVTRAVAAARAESFIEVRELEEH